MRPPRSVSLPLVPFLALVGLSLAYRVPAIVNAATVDSDAAIVGLQARHILAGEHSWFLHGSGYQTSVDSCVAALFFVVLGATPLALLLSTLLGHISATCLAFATLRRHMPGSAAFVAVLPLVFTGTPLHTYILNPPRQAALTLVFLAVFVIAGASARASERHRLVEVALGAGIASVACFADPYALLVLPGLLLLAGLTAWDRSVVGPGARLARLAAVVVGALLGIVPFVLLVRSPHAVHGETTLTLSVLRHNADLFLDTCFPWLVGATVYVPKALLGYVPWQPGLLVHAVQRLGAGLFVLLITTGGLAVFAPRASVSWPARRLGAFGFVVAGLTVASFLVSVMVMDLFSSRYLAALVLMSPFALAPFAARAGATRLFVVLSFYLVASGLSGWLGYGDEVDGPRVVTLPGHGSADELALEQALAARGVHVAIADYWVSYRLTFLYGEALAVIPIHAQEARYPPYRRAYAAATRTAYIFDPKRSRESLTAMEAQAFAGAEPWGVPVERLEAGALTGIVFDKPSR